MYEGDKMILLLFYMVKRRRIIMQYTYHTRQIHLEGLTAYTYDICTAPNNLILVKDFSTNETLVKKFIHILSDYAVSPLHALDIAREYLDS